MQLHVSFVLFYSTLQNSTTTTPTAQIIANATHGQLRQFENLAYTQVYNAYTKAQAEADTIR